MIIRGIKNWKADKSNLPGGFDYLHDEVRFSSKNKYQLPDVFKFDEDLPDIAIPFNMFRQKNYGKKKTLTLLHFFVDDYRFENLWRKPIGVIKRIERAGYCTAPDFSLFRGMPYPLQLFNVYRNRWVTRFWQEMGLRIIPTVCWSDKSSFEYCFEGIPTESKVAISTFGLRKEEFCFFVAGFYEMIRRIRPVEILCVGKKFEKEVNLLDDNIKFYPSFWEYKKYEKSKINFRKS